VEGNSGGESETIIGKWLKNKDRRSVVIATKVRGRMWAGPNGEGLSRVHIVHTVEDSLRRLQTDYIDLYQLHATDDQTPLDETLEAMDKLVRDGKVLYTGVSNFPAWLLMKSLWISDVKHLTRFDSLQPHYSLLHRSEFEQELEPLCLDQGIGVIPYSPLAAGFLTGKYTRENRQPDTTRSSGRLIQSLINNEHAYNVVDEVKRIAAVHEVSVPQVALAWMLARPSITAPIIGARTVEQLEELIGATELELTQQEIDTLNELTKEDIRLS
jgi:aryl-alcohol dehydrogenase-like predicted oxidoreductase